MGLLASVRMRGWLSPCVLFVCDRTTNRDVRVTSCLHQERSSLRAELMATTPGGKGGDIHRLALVEKMVVLLRLEEKPDEALAFAEEQLELAERLYGHSTLLDATYACANGVWHGMVITVLTNVPN